MEETISLQEIITLLKKKASLIMSMFFVGIGISAIATFMLITPKYSSGAQLIASSKNTDSSVSTDNINSNLLMINTYKDFIKGQIVTEAARDRLAEEIGFKGTSEDVKNMVSVEQTQNSQMFTINVTSENPLESATAANVVADIFKEEAGEYTDADKVSIISTAEVPVAPVSPNKQINLAIGGILGLIVGIGLALVSQLFNRTVKSSDYISESLNIPILGNIPLTDPKELKILKNGQSAALASADHITESVDSGHNFDGTLDGIDGLDEDLSRIDNGPNLEETIDLSSLKINHIDLSDMNLENEDHSTIGLGRRSR